MREIIQGIIETLPPELIPKLEAEFRRGWHMEAVNAEITQTRVAQAEHQRGTCPSMDGVGRLRMRVNTASYHSWGQRLGYGCWSDKQFLKEYEQANPSVRVKSGGTKIQTGYGGKS